VSANIALLVFYNTQCGDIHPEHLNQSAYHLAVWMLSAACSCLDGALGQGEIIADRDAMPETLLR
jgi:hypothetical protein